MDNAAREEENAALVSAFADTITQQVEAFAEEHNIDRCRVTLSVAAQLLDDIMNNGHSACAFSLANGAAQEAKRRIMEELSPEILAQFLKDASEPMEH